MPAYDTASMFGADEPQYGTAPDALVNKQSNAGESKLNHRPETAPSAKQSAQPEPDDTELAADSYSILFPDPCRYPDADDATEPTCFRDLNLDQIVQAVVSGRDEYNLMSFFHIPLKSLDDVRYRLEVFRDLERADAVSQVRQFADSMRTVRQFRATAEASHYKYENFRWLLDSCELYCDAVAHLEQALAHLDPRSRGLRRILEFLEIYIRSDRFLELVRDTKQRAGDLSKIRYCLRIAGNRIIATKYQPEPDYGDELIATFEKFARPSQKDYTFSDKSNGGLNHIEGAVLDMVAQLYPETFAGLEQHYNQHRDSLNEALVAFDREIQFYIAWIDHVERLRQAGLAFCYPTVSDTSKEIFGQDVFDLALANTLVHERRSLVSNDFSLRDPERIMVISGPNQGGKTTFARTIGQLHYLAALGCPVPGRRVSVFLCDHIFTHFEKREDIGTQTGKLEDELLRMHDVFEHATSHSLLIMNEGFGSTTPSDALFLGRRIMERVMALDMLCVSVTFIDELSTFSQTTVSMVSTIDPEDPSHRTFKIIRQRADGRAYAMALAEQYGLEATAIQDRIAANSRGI